MAGGIASETGKGPYRTLVPVWKASVTVTPGDLVFRDGSGYDLPASSFTWDTNIATTSAKFRPSFRGVASARRDGTRQAADGGKVHGLILGSGEFYHLLDAAATAVQVAGSFVSVAKASGNALENQKVTLTATISNAIGRLTEDVRVGDIAAKWECRPALGPWDGVLSYYDNSSIQAVGVTSTAPTA